MTKRPSAAARALAAIAVLCGFVALIVVISTSFGGDGDDRSGNAPARQAPGKVKQRPAAYVVQNGDTLISIARSTGVSVARLEALNPGVDPQILVSGERLKLR